MKLFKNFRYQILLRISFLTLTIVSIDWSFNQNYFITPWFLVLVLALELLSLFAFLNKTNRIFIDFLQAIKYSEFTHTFEVFGKGSSFDELKSAFNKVMADFRKIRNEREEGKIFLENTVQHLGTGLLAFDQTGQILMFNNAGRKLLPLHGFKNIQKLKEFNPKLYEFIFSLKNQSKELFFSEDNQQKLSFNCKKFTLSNGDITLLSIQDITKELSQKEVESWQKLIRVLTHEIMNSITPITSLSQTSVSIMENYQQKNNTDQDLEKIVKAVKTINKRSEGLLTFVQRYRELTRVPKPQKEKFILRDFFKEIETLLKEELKKDKVELKIKLSTENIELYADKNQVEQVVINLIKNSLDAVKKSKNPLIELIGKITDKSEIEVIIKDNGQGIIPDALEKIFIPFYTTKAQGSGIGLSLSRQIMHNHNGEIFLESKVDEGTRVRLVF